MAFFLKEIKIKEKMADESAMRGKITSGVGFTGKILAGINPEFYTDGVKINKKKFTAEVKKDFWEALGNMGKIGVKAVSLEEHSLTYQSSSETLEPVYFWILDLMNSMFGGKVEKIVDNFVSTPGSGHFSELMGKATKMQEEAMKIMNVENAIIKSIMNIIYDLKEFEIRLEQYEMAKSKDKEKAESGILALKQIWMDQVDIKRGNGSINALSTGNLNFITLRDAFMAVSSPEEVDKMDLNDRVKRILKPRIAEFLDWKIKSERELRKRYQIEKTYLKSQVSSLKMYSRWAKPYLRAAAQLEQPERLGSPDLVTAFNTIRLELTLLGKNEVDFEGAIVNKQLPQYFKKEKFLRKYKQRTYHPCVLVDFYFRGIPQRIGQHYVFGGRAEVTFRAYALNSEEIEILKRKLDESDLKDALNLVEGMTSESLGELEEDIRKYIEGEEEKEEGREEEKEDVNPFAALFGFLKKSEKPKKEGEKKLEITEIKKDNTMEQLIRKIADEDARKICFNLFDIYKKAHGMASPL